jgi:hypothetical protein
VSSSLVLAWATCIYRKRIRCSRSAIIIGSRRKQAAWKMKECTDACLKMCDATNTVNDFVVYLMLNNLILESYCAGDESMFSQRSLSN